MGETKEKKEGMEENGLVLRGSVTPAVISINYEELKQSLEEKLKDCQNLIVTDDTLEGAKNAKKELVSLRNRLEEFRKNAKKKAEVQVKDFDVKCKSLSNLIIETEMPLARSLDVYDEKIRQKKRDFAIKEIAKAVETFGLRDEYGKKLQIKPEFTNMTITQKAVKADILQQAEKLKKEQNENDHNLSIIKETVENENKRLQVKMNPDDYESLFVQGMDSILVIRRIKSQADSIFSQEQKLEKERLERERQEQERLEREKTETDKTDSYYVEMPSFIQEELDMPEFVPEDNYSVQQLVPKENKAATDNTGINVPKREVKSDLPVQQYEVVFKVKGCFVDLRELQNYITENEISMEVISQKKLKK